MKSVGIVSSSNQLFELNNQTGSQNSVNNLTQAVTSSILNTIYDIQALTASFKAASIVSSSTQIQNYNLFAVTSSANVFWGNQSISGALHVRDGVTGSFKGNLDGTATSATNVLIGNSSTNTNYAMLFATAGVNGYLNPYTDVVGGVLYNPSTNKLAVSGSVEVSGSFNVYGGTITGSILATNGVLSSSAQISELTQIAPLQAYTASLKTAFSVSGTTTTHNGPVDLGGYSVYSNWGTPANINNGNTTTFTYQQTSGEYQVQFQYNILGLYAPSGTNLSGYASGIVHFMADGSTNNAAVSSIGSNGWTVSASATNAGAFTITFTNSSGATMSNVNYRITKLNRTGGG